MCCFSKIIERSGNANLSFYNVYVLIVVVKIRFNKEIISHAVKSLHSTGSLLRTFNDLDSVPTLRVF